MWWGWSLGSSGGCPRPCTHCSIKETANAAAFKHWRQAGAKSPQAAVSGYVATHTAAAPGAASPAWPRLASSWQGQGRDGPAGARRTLARQDASDFDPASHADFGAATHPGVGGGTHRRRATADRCEVVWSCVSFVCSVVWWFMCCVCCACDLCFVLVSHPTTWAPQAKTIPSKFLPLEQVNGRYR